MSEVNTVFPGQIDDFFKKTEVMQRYFAKVINSEKKVFGEIGFLPSNIRTLSIKSGDLNRLDRSQLEEALHSDVYVVFGASYIKGWLIDFLVQRKVRSISIWGFPLSTEVHHATFGLSMTIIPRMSVQLFTC